MADVDINKFRASVVREGSKPASPGFIVSEGQSPTNPAGSGQNHLPVTIATAATGLSITESQVLGGAGNVGQYIRGDGSLADFPESSGGGSSVSYYLNGSVSQGTIGGVAYKELNKVPILGAGTDFTINADGYIASFITDAGDPNLLEIAGGNWNFETYFSASSGGGSPSFYVELYKVNAGGTATLIASNSTFPELIAFGTNIISYFSTLAVPTTTLALTDRLAIRYYVTHSGRTITLHTEDNHLCQIITTFTTGITALNGLTAQVQNFAVGTSGTDFNIASATATHTFNLPTASATNRGALSSADWTTFNNKQNALGYVPVPETRTITINGVSQDLSANRTYNVGTVTSVGLSSATSGVTIGGSPVTGVGAFTLAIATASGSQNGLLSSTDWTTFNSKQNALNGTGFVVASGTTISYDNTNYLPLTGGTLTGSLIVENNAITQDGTRPILTLQQSGTTKVFLGISSGASDLVTGDASGDAVFRKPASSGAYRFSVDGGSSSALVLQSNGNLLVGTSSDNGARLQVSGTATILGPTVTIGNAVAATNVKLIFNGVASKAAGIEFHQSGTPQWYIGNGIASEDNNFELYNSNGTMAMKIIKSTNAINFIGAATFSGDVTISRTSPTFRLTRGNTSSSSLVVYNTNGIDNWLVGTGVTGTNTNYRIYNNSLGADAIYIVNSNNNVLIGTTTDAGARLYITGGLVSNMLSLRSSNGTATNLNFTSESPAGSTDNYTINHTMVHGSGGGYRIEHNVSSRWIRMIAGTGGVELAGGATSWAAISDIRVKNIIGNIENSLDAINSLSAIKYTLKTDLTNKKRVGLIAQEVQEILPESVEVDEKGILSVRYTEIIPLIVEAIKELNKKIK